MASIWEKVGFGLFWTILGAGAAAIGTSHYLIERHKVEDSVITRLTDRVRDLETKNDVLRKEASDAKTLSEAASALTSCRAQMENIRHVQNTSAIEEIHRLEQAIIQDEHHLASGLIYSWSEGEPTRNNDSPNDRIVKERLAAERLDLSAMRQKLVCAP